MSFFSEKDSLFLREFCTVACTYISHTWHFAFSGQPVHLGRNDIRMAIIDIRKY
jgi:hypothetical protein